jgi:pimeloyl-ACP methyl ester carboxylesterase
MSGDGGNQLCAPLGRRTVRTHGVLALAPDQRGHGRSATPQRIEDISVTGLSAR